MSISLATKGIIGGYSGGGGGGSPYPVGVEEAELDTDDIRGPFLDASTEIFIADPSPVEAGEVVPSRVKAEGMARITPQLNTFPGPNDL